MHTGGHGNGRALSRLSCGMRSLNPLKTGRYSDWRRRGPAERSGPYQSPETQRDESAMNSSHSSLRAVPHEGRFHCHFAKSSCLIVCFTRAHCRPAWRKSALGEAGVATASRRGYHFRGIDSAIAYLQGEQRDSLIYSPPRRGSEDWIIGLAGHPRETGRGASRRGGAICGWGARFAMDRGSTKWTWYIWGIPVCEE